MKDSSKCRGCRDDYYNQNQDGCWSLPTAKVVTRYQLYWWADPTVKANYTKVKVPSCYRQPGQYVYWESIQRGAK